MFWSQLLSSCKSLELVVCVGTEFAILDSNGPAPGVWSDAGFLREEPLDFGCDCPMVARAQANVVVGEKLLLLRQSAQTSGVEWPEFLAFDQAVPDLTHRRGLAESPE